MSLQKITAQVGPRVTGVDPSADLPDSAVALLREALAEHKALVLDAPGPDAVGQEHLARLLGPLTAAHPTDSGIAA